MPAEIVRLGVADGPDPAVNALVAGVPLVDHHVHAIVRGPVSPADLVFTLSESDRRGAADAAGLDTQLGVAVRRWCGPLLGLPQSVDAAEYLEQRSRLANEEVAARLLPEAGLERLLVETGFRGDDLVAPAELGRLAGAPVDRVVRLETLAESVAVSGIAAAGFAGAFRAALQAEAREAIGFKSVVAYRGGFEFEPSRPSDAEVAEQAGTWLRGIESSGRVRLTDQTIERFLLWEAASTGKPLQLHTGFGDPDLDLHRADPLLLTDFIRATEGVCPILLLHTYPFHRNAGYLAQMFPHVFMDIGLAVNYSGAQSSQLVAESLELAPFRKILYSSDGWGVPELHLLGSWLFRRGLSRVLGGWVQRGDWSSADAERVVRLIAAENARRVYGLPAPE